jgi:hypothetical protein
MSEMDDGKVQALMEFSFLAAKEGGYTGTIVGDDVFSASNTYIVPMISAL